MPRAIFAEEQEWYPYLEECIKVFNTFPKRISEHNSVTGVRTHLV